MSTAAPSSRSSCPPVPEPPRLDRWPEALRSAERLRGTVVPCGPGLRGVGWPETPRVRLVALAPWLEAGGAATHLTAAWVWGAARSPGRPLRVTTRSDRRRSRRNSEFLRIQERHYPPSDVSQFGEFSVTTPVRTTLDLLHDPMAFGRAERLACRLLCLMIDGATARVLEEIRSHRRPYRRLALDRAATLGGATKNPAEPTRSR